MNSSPLNPDAPVFVPGSVVGADVLLAESPRKPLPMDDIELPDVAQFQTEAVVRPAELQDLDNCDQLNGHHNISIDEGEGEKLNGKDKCNMDSLGFGFNVGIEPEKVKDTGLIQDFERIQKDTTDFCNIQVYQTHTETNPFTVESNEELVERLKNKERDPMSMSFYQEKDDDTCERLSKNDSHVDLNAVQLLPDSDDDEQQNGTCDDVTESDKENISPSQNTDLFDLERSVVEPNNDIMRFDERTDTSTTNALHFGQRDNFVDYLTNTSNSQNFSNIEFDSCHVSQETVAQTDTPESHKLMFEQIPEIPDGKSSELGFVNDDIHDPSERDEDTRALTQDTLEDSDRDSAPFVETQPELSSIALKEENEGIVCQAEINQTSTEFIIKEDELVPEPALIVDTQPIPTEELPVSPTSSENIIRDTMSPELTQKQEFNQLSELEHEEIAEIETDVELPEIQLEVAATEDILVVESPLPAKSPLPVQSPLHTESPLPTETPLLNEALLPTQESQLPLESLLHTESPLPSDSPLPTLSPVPIERSQLLESSLQMESSMPTQDNMLPCESTLTNEMLVNEAQLLEEQQLTSESPQQSISPMPKESLLQNESPLPMESLPVDILSNTETNLEVPVAGSPRTVSPLPAEVPLPRESPLLRESPLPRESPIPRDSPLPQESPVPRESPLPRETSLPRESPIPQETSLPRESPLPRETSLPRESPLPTESSLPRESPIPTECQLDIKSVELTQTQASDQEPKTTVPEIEMLAASPIQIEAEATSLTVSPQPVEELTEAIINEVSPVEGDIVETKIDYTAVEAYIDLPAESPIATFESQTEQILSVDAENKDFGVKTQTDPTPSIMETEISFEEVAPTVPVNTICDSALEPEIVSVATESGTGPTPDIVPEERTELRAELVTDIDIGIPESRAQEICVPVTSEIQLDDGVQAATATPPPTPAVEPAPLAAAPVDEPSAAPIVAAAAAATAAVVAAAAITAPKSKTPATKKSPTTPTAKSDARTPKSVPKTSAVPKSPASAIAARRSASAAPTPTRPSPAATARPATARTVGAAKPAAPRQVAPAKSLASKPTAAAPKQTAAAPKPATRPTPAAREAPSTARTVPASRAMPKPAAITRPAPSAAAPKLTSKPSSAATRPPTRPVTTSSATTAAAKPRPKLPEKKPLANGETKPAATKPAPRPIAARPAPRATPAAPLTKSAAPKPAMRTTQPLDKQSKDLANKRITAKAAPPRTAATKTTAAAKTVVKSVPKKLIESLNKPVVIAQQNGLSNGASEELSKPPLSPPAADNALLPDVIA